MKEWEDLGQGILPTHGVPLVGEESSQTGFSSESLRNDSVSTQKLLLKNSSKKKTWEILSQKGSMRQIRDFITNCLQKALCDVTEYNSNIDPFSAVLTV